MKNKKKVVKKRKSIRKVEEIEKVIENYFININGRKYEVKIIKQGAIYKYVLSLPRISEANRNVLLSIRNQLIKELKIPLEIHSQEVIEATRREIARRAEEIIKEKIPGISYNLLKDFVIYLVNEMVGLGNIEFLANDSLLEEIVIVNSKEPIRVYHKKYGWLETNLYIESEEQIENYASIIARRVGRQITNLQPLLDAHLLTGDRANAVLYPISTKGNTITIRKFAREPWTVVDLVENKTTSSLIFALLWQAIEYEMNILISGGTASGKTTFLNVLSSFFPLNHRIISIEDTRELQLPDYLYWTPLVTRLPNPEGKGEVTMLDLLVNSLRMRPDRIILGEIRRAREAEVLFEAMHTGHSVYATLHADTVAQTIRRLTNPPINLPSNLLSAVNLNVVMFRDRRKGIRRVYQLGEFIEEEEKISGNIVYRWEPTKDTVIQHSAPLRYFEDLSRNTGMSENEIIKDIEERKKFIDWLVKNKVKGFKNVTMHIRNYYEEREKLLKKIK